MPPTEPELRKLVREALHAGKLPRREPDYTWGGNGCGATCTICQELVRADQVEYEVQFAHDGSRRGMDQFHMHFRCFAVWERERTTLQT
jgi:hypothetical protein